MYNMVLGVVIILEDLFTAYLNIGGDRWDQTQDLLNTNLAH
jgi:hypothetical protein